MKIAMPKLTPSLVYYAACKPCHTWAMNQFHKSSANPIKFFQISFESHPHECHRRSDVNLPSESSRVDLSPLKTDRLKDFSETLDNGALALQFLFRDVKSSIMSHCALDSPFYNYFSIKNNKKQFPAFIT